MLKKGYRLTTRDVRYLVKKRNYFVHDMIGMYYIPQYPDRQYNQFSVTIGVNISKSAVMRHFLKRVFMRYIAENTLVEKKFSQWYYKCFLMIHKAQIPVLQKLIANSDKNAIQKVLEDKCDIFFSSLYRRLWVSSKK